MAAETSISVRGLSKSFRRRTRKSDTLKGTLLGLLKGRRSEVAVQQALDDVSFDVKAGSTYAVIGSNGSGKSTLLKIMAGILSPTSGSLQVNGRVAALIELGAGFHPEISGRENVIINGILMGLDRREVERKLPEIVAYAELEHAIDEPVKAYSSGMYVRLGFAVATAVDPDVLLVDEVLAVGDEAFSHKCIERFSDFKRRGKTIVLVTHSLDLAEELADEACWLDRGRMRTHGYPREVTAAYRSLVAAQEDARLSSEAEQSSATKAAEPTAAEPDPRAPRRWGDGSVTIDSVRLVEAGGGERRSYSCGDTLALEVLVSAREPVTDYVFGVAFFGEDGKCVYGTNSELEGFVPGRLSGSGKVTLSFPDLKLLEGRYALDVAIHRSNGAAYDYRLGVLSFRVNNPLKEVGCVRLEHSWQTEGGVELQRSEGGN